jgi:NAD dependent epimerase/dehydratase family enzyme
MKVGITGATGFIGSQVSVDCAAKGHEPIAFSRRPAAGGRLLSLDAVPDLSSLDAIVNLAGENLLGLWTPEKKRRLSESRVLTTRRLVDAMRTMAKPPFVLINASAIGFYGTREAQPTKRAFGQDSATLCHDWESEAIRAESRVPGCLHPHRFVLGLEGRSS